MNFKGTILCSLALIIAPALFSCATQPKPAAKSPAQGQELKQPQGPGIVKSQAGVPFMSGGIGVEERNQMRQAAKAYNLGLSFAGKSRGYLTDVGVVITDDKGRQVLSAANTGPWFYAQLPPGKYTVKATYNGKIREVKNLRLKKDSAERQTVYWDID